MFLRRPPAPAPAIDMEKSMRLAQQSCATTSEFYDAEVKHIVTLLDSVVENFTRMALDKNAQSAIPNPLAEATQAAFKRFKQAYRQFAETAKLNRTAIDFYNEEAVKKAMISMEISFDDITKKDVKENLPKMQENRSFLEISLKAGVNEIKNIKLKAEVERFNKEQAPVPVQRRRNGCFS
jgi:hypothetical protein